MQNKATILIVDDIKENLKLLSEILTENGYTVRPANSGELALTSAFIERPDLVLLDVRMPEVDGFEVCRRLKANASTADIPVIFVSAYDELSDRLAGFELGAVDFITKPFEPKEIIARINNQLEISRLRSQLECQTAELLMSNRQLYDEIEQRKQIENQLQDKAEEVEVQNEELQCQSEELKSQNDEYQSVNEELQRTKEEIKQSEMKYRLIFDHSPLGILSFDEKGAITACNERFAKIVGSSVERLTGLVMLNLPDKKLVKEVAKALAGGTGLYEDDYHSTTAVKITPVRVIFTSMSDENGKIAGGVGIIEDVSERKKAEAATIKLQEQLNQAQKMESVGRLAGGVAHDFNNMLSVILGQANLAMLKLEADHPLRYTFEQIINAGNRSADLTRQLLAFARKQIVAPRILNLNDAVGNMFKILKRLIGENIDLVWQPADQLLNVKIDPTQLDQLLANLVVNARDAISGEGEIIVSASQIKIDEEFCKYHAEFEPGDFVILEVSDNGCGMTKEVAEQIFDPFFTTKGSGKGTGLGMAMVYGIVKQNNGFISVYSEPGVGTSFKIYLPYFDVNPAEKYVGTETSKLTGGFETILVVEDESIVLSISKEMLENLGYTVLAAETPEKAIALAKEHAGNIQLLLTDVIMPKMNGRDLANHLHSLYPDLKILFTSGYTADSIDQHGMLEEGVRFIQKPFTMQQLEEKVRESLNN